MANDRRFRFGAQLSYAGSAKEWAAKARRVEELGYSTLCVPDHFDDQLAPFPALVAAAAATSSLRVGTLVLDNDYRHPLVAAKEAAAEVRRRKIPAVVVDAEDGHTRLGLAAELADSMGARYLTLPQLTAATVRQLTGG